MIDRTFFLSVTAMITLLTFTLWFGFYELKFVVHQQNIKNVLIKRYETYTSKVNLFSDQLQTWKSLKNAYANITNNSLFLAKTGEDLERHIQNVSEPLGLTSFRYEIYPASTLKDHQLVFSLVKIWASAETDTQIYHLIHELEKNQAAILIPCAFEIQKTGVENQEGVSAVYTFFWGYYPMEKFEFYSYFLGWFCGTTLWKPYT